jgi:hypothetical protein
LAGFNYPISRILIGRKLNGCDFVARNPFSVLKVENRPFFSFFHFFLHFGCILIKIFLLSQQKCPVVEKVLAGKVLAREALSAIEKSSAITFRG